MTCAELEEQSLALVALPADDPERVAAEAHARGCEACARSLSEARSMLSAVTAFGTPAPPQTVALARAARGARADLLHRGRPRGFAAAGVVLGGAVVALLAKHRAVDPRSLLIAGAALAAALCAAVVVPPRRARAAGLAIVGSAFLVAIAGGAGILDPVVGVKCTLLELFAAAVPLATTLLLVRRRRGRAEPLFLVGIAAAGALAGQGALHLTCPDRLAAPHLAAFHFGGVLGAAALGWLASRWARFLTPPLRP